MKRQGLNKRKVSSVCSLCLYLYGQNSEVFLKTMQVYHQIFFLENKYTIGEILSNTIFL